ncbi:hypothetical protein ACOMHN_012866 [Nucella lapillus]
MSRYFDTMSPAVFASSVGIMDSALIRVNIPGKYLSCFSAACFIIASKWIEDEYQPSISILAELHSKQWKEVDLRRMEERILQLLSWEMPACTYLHFLPHLSHLLALSHPHLSVPPVSRVVCNAEMLLLKEFSFVMKPAAVALGALHHTLRQCGVLTQRVTGTIISLQDFLKVLDSELYEIDEALNTEGSVPHTEHKSNKAYFPKVFETPYDSFCPDYRLYRIPEECNGSEADLKPSLKRQPSPNVSFSDYDYSDDEAPSSPREKTVVSSDCTAITDDPPQQSLSAGGDHSSDQSLEHVTAQFSLTVLDSGPSQDIPEQNSTVQSSSDVLETRSSIQSDSREEKCNDDDSGCEEKDSDDEQDSCGEQDSSEQDVCSEHDSGCDPDSDFQDSSPCRMCHVKSCVDEVQGQALTFN